MKNTTAEDDTYQVSKILRDFNQPEKWKNSPWLSSYLVKDYLLSGKSQTPYQAVRDVFSDILDLLLQESPYYGDILRGRFWEGQHVAEMVKNGRPQYWEERNFYIYQKKAIARFTFLLSEREQRCQKIMLQSKPKNMAIFSKYRIAIISILFFALLSLFIVFDKETYFPAKSYSEGTLPSSSNLFIPTSTNREITFQENFENGTADDFKNKLGLWIIVSEANGNKVLDINSMDNSIEYPTIEFGESDWKNFILESRINIIDYKDSPLVSIRFRGNYLLTFAPYWNSIGLAFDPPWEDITYRTIELQKNKWYPFRIEVEDSKINVFLENKLIISQEISNEISGIVGFGTWPETHVQFDDVVIMLIQ